MKHKRKPHRETVGDTCQGSEISPLITYGYTAFMAVLVPVYWMNYGPTNFLYFCDIALFLVLIAVWTNSRLAASMGAVGILVPQALWCVDFAVELAGGHLTHMTSYMFDADKSLLLRGLSLFHGWLPFLLLWLVWKLGYDKRALGAGTVVAWSACLISYFFLPPAGAQLLDPNLPINVNYVYGFDNNKPQEWMSEPAYLVIWMMSLLMDCYVPTHLALRRFSKQSSEQFRDASGERR